MVTTLTRTVQFSAGHHYGKADWSDDRNRQVFGDARFAHGHDYTVAVTVGGRPDPDTGFVVDLAKLDALLDSEVRHPFHRSHLNEVVDEFRDGRSQPSTEALAGVIWARLEDRIPGTANLERVRVSESATLFSEVSRSP